MPPPDLGADVVEGIKSVAYSCIASFPPLFLCVFLYPDESCLSFHQVCAMHGAKNAVRAESGVPQLNDRCMVPPSLVRSVQGRTLGLWGNMG